MANIVNPPARINRNTAADGDFLWKQDFEVLYNNDVALEQAIQQASQDYTAGDGINIDPSTKTISVKTGTGIEKTEEGLSVKIEGVDGAKVELNGNTYKVSAYNAEPAIDGLNNNLEDLQNELTSFENEVKEKYITSGNEMVPNHQYVYTTSGWADIGGEHATVSYWRPTYNESTGKLSWQMSPSIEAPADALVKGDKGDDGKTPEFRINQSTNFWEWKYTDVQNWTSTNTSATGSRGAQGEQGIQGYTPEISTATDTEHSGTKVTFSWPEESHIEPTNFTIPSGAPGTPGINGTDGASGKTPKLQINSTTNYWEVSYDNGGTWTSLNVEATGPQGSPGFDPVVTTSIIAPDPLNPDHKNGGTKIIISNKTGTPAEASAWNGNDGDATTIEFDTATGHTMSGNGGASYPYGVNTSVIATQAWVADQGYLTTIPDSYATKNYANDASANALTQAKSWVNQQGYLKQSDLNGYATETYVDTASAETLSQAKTWVEEQRYLPTSGGTVSGQLVLSATTQTFDNSYLKCINNANVGHAIFGLGSGGGAVIKTVNGSNESVQVNVNAGSNNSQLIEVKTNNGTTQAGYLIPAKIHVGSYSPSEDDKILHIVIES